MSSREILIADDAGTVRTLIEMKMRSVLEGFGYRQAQNGLVALEEIVRNPPAAMMLDVNMPVLDGSTVMLLLRRAAEHAGDDLMARLEGGTKRSGLVVAGYDASFKLQDPFHPRRGGYESPEVDEALVELLVRLDAKFHQDMDAGPDSMSLSALPRYLLGEILGREALRQIPVLLITTLSNSDHRERFERLGPPDAFLGKPFDAAHAARTVSALIGV